MGPGRDRAVRGGGARPGLRGAGPGCREGGSPRRPFPELAPAPLGFSGGRGWRQETFLTRGQIQRPERDLGLRVLASALPFNLGHTPCCAQGLVWLLWPSEVEAGLPGGRLTLLNLTLPLRGAFLGKSLELLAVFAVNPHPGTQDSSSACWLLLQGPQLAGPVLVYSWPAPVGPGTTAAPSRAVHRLPPTDAGAGHRGGEQRGTGGPDPGSAAPEPGLRARGKASQPRAPSP